MTAALCGLVAGGGIRDASARGVFERRTVDARHELVAHAYHPGAASRVFITQQHGGAVLFHTGAPVLRWDLIDPDALDGALAWLTTRGLTPVFLLDADEEPVFRSRFAGRGAWAGLDWPAHVDNRSPAARTRLRASRPRPFRGRCQVESATVAALTHPSRP